MQQWLLFALLGLGTGAQIAGIAQGLVLTYRGSGVINLATGAMAMLAAYFFWILRTGQIAGLTLATVPAILVALVLMLILGFLIESVTFRPLRTASPLAKLVSSLGVLLIAESSIQLIFGSSPVQSPDVLPSNQVTVFGVPTPVSHFILAGLVIAIAICLTALYRFTRFGVATRAASEGEVSALLAGLSPNQLSLANTLLTNLVVGLLGILAASLASLDPTTLPLMVVPALAAALFARFTSFWIACLAGLLIGMSESMLYYASTLSWYPKTDGVALPGVQQLLEFVLVVIALWWRGSNLPQRGEFVERSLPAVPVQPRVLRRMALPIAVCAVALVVLPYDFRSALITGLIAMILCLSLVVISGYVGQLSVIQLALSGVAGFAVSHLATGSGIEFPLGALLGVLAATVVGILVGFSALRVRGVSLVVVTLAAAVAIQEFVFANGSWGGGLTGASVPPPHFLGFDLSTEAGLRGLDGLLPSSIFGFFTLAVGAVMYLLVTNLRRTDLGRRMLAVRSNERAAAAATVNVPMVKMIAFTIGSAIAGVAGVMYAYNFGSISGTRFDGMTALALIAGVYVTGITMPQGAVLAGLATAGAIMPLIMEKTILPATNIGIVTSLISGAGLLLQLNLFPEGIVGSMWKKRERRERERAGRASARLGPQGLEAAGVSLRGAAPGADR